MPGPLLVLRFRSPPRATTSCDGKGNTQEETVTYNCRYIHSFIRRGESFAEDHGSLSVKPCSSFASRRLIRGSGAELTTVQGSAWAGWSLRTCRSQLFFKDYYIHTVLRSRNSCTNVLGPGIRAPGRPFRTVASEQPHPSLTSCIRRLNACALHSPPSEFSGQLWPSCCCGSTHAEASTPPRSERKKHGF